MHIRRRIFVVAVSAAALALGACGSSGTESTSASNATPTTAGAAGATSTTTATGTSAASGSTVTKKVKIKTATKDEIVAAFTANGVQNAGRWAGEVLEYREEEATLAHLKSELAKYKPSQDQLDKILASLEE